MRISQKEKETNAEVAAADVTRPLIKTIENILIPEICSRRYKQRDWPYAGKYQARETEEEKERCGKINSITNTSC